jgi:hypothetical protein
MQYTFHNWRFIWDMVFPPNINIIMTYQKFFALSLILLFVHAALYAQRPTGSDARGGGAPIARIYGKVLEGNTGKPIPYASVLLHHIRKDSLVSGAMTRENGFFDIKDVSPGMYQLKISFLGFADTTIVVKLVPPNIVLDAGNIRLENAATTLNEVNITGQRSSIELAVDRRIYNVDRNLAATGGTAIDALKNIPSVSVDTEGNVELRSSAPRIFIDGKPSQLTLEQIPASEIEKVEVITNPSARYEASAAGGIINIVLKKNKLPGIFSTLNLGVGTNDRYNGMASLNLRQSPIALSLSYNFNTGNNPAYGYNYLERLQDGARTSYFKQDGITSHKRLMHFVRVGLDYDINVRNTLSLSGNFNVHKMNFGDDQIFENQLPSSVIDYTGTRDALSHRNSFNHSAQLDYRRIFPKLGKEWVSFVQYARGTGTGDSDIRQVFKDINGTEWPNSPDLIKSISENEGDTYQFQTDFINPLGDNKKLELGGRFQYKDNFNDTQAERTDSTGALASFPLLSLKYNYREIISAAYANYITRKDKFGYQLGFRLEQSDFVGEIPGTDSSFSYRFPSDLSDIKNLIFPSVFVTYTLKEGQDLQFNIARKLERPNFFQLMPFLWQQDNQTYRAGNPNLQPEFRYVSELNYALTKNWGTSFTSVYGRYEDSPVTSVVRRATDGTQSLINTYINGENNTRFGFEQSLKYRILKNMDLTGGVNVFRNQIKANLDGVVLNNSGWNWDAKAAIEWRIIKNWVFQTNGDYEAARIIPQGRTKPNYGMDLAIKRTLNQLGSLTLQVNDVFNSRGRGQTFVTDTYVQELWRRREVRFVQVSAQLRFGKPDAAIFKKGRPQARQSGGGDMDF